MIDVHRIAFLLGKKQPSILKDYLDRVANKSLLRYRHHFQWGGKKGESLYIHILDGIFLLDELRSLLSLDETATRVLFTGYTVHDINKMVAQESSFNKLAVEDRIEQLINELGLSAFFPAWRDYLADMVSLVRGHGGSTFTSGEMLIPKRAHEYKLGWKRVETLRLLMKAVDRIDLSHTLDERPHKQFFLDHLNAYLAQNGQPQQWSWFFHQLTEQRGLLSNILHSAITEEFRRHDLHPILYYPDGVVYLIQKGGEFIVDDALLERVAARAAQAINAMTQSKFRQFINSRSAGIKIDAKCLELGVPFDGPNSILEAIEDIIARRDFDAESLDARVRNRVQRNFEKRAIRNPEAARLLQMRLNKPAPIVPKREDLLRVAELVRTYFIFLNDHFKKEIPDIWGHLYDLLELPHDRRSLYEFFDARYDRAYFLIPDSPLSPDAIRQRIAQDGARRLAQRQQFDPKADYLADYLRRYAVFGEHGRPGVQFQSHLAHYMASQHKQCVFCGSDFPTAKWMTDDVRKDITVQVFSNRLQGGPGEPKKRICAICKMQFLLEKLNYPPVGKEKLLYLHLFPYAFLSAPHIETLQETFQSISESGESLVALNMDAREAIRYWLENRSDAPNFFRIRTKEGKPQPYGVYIPRYSQTVGNLIVLPLNAAGQNDTERFLFALWNALVFQRHFGVKVILTTSSTPPLEKQDFGDLYIDNIPLAVQGLLPENDFRQFLPGQGNQPGNLPLLWEKVHHLFALAQAVSTPNDDPRPRLVRAMATHPLAMYHEMDRLLVKKYDSQQGALLTWNYQQALPHISAITQFQGGVFVKKLSQHLEELASIAWQGYLRGHSLERNSLLSPFNQVMEKMALLASHRSVDIDTLKAAAAEDIFDHLERLARQQGYAIGKQRMQTCVDFVNGWFDGVLQGVYEGNVRKLLADEKLLRSAFLFYLRAQIPSKREENASPASQSV